MAKVAQSMLRNALDGFIHRDARLGRAVLLQDDVIDELNRKTVTGFVKMMKGDQNTIDAGLDLIRISRNLERVADLSTNIAEEVIFMAQARVVKHHAAEAEPGSQPYPPFPPLSYRRPELQPRFRALYRVQEEVVSYFLPTCH